MEKIIKDLLIEVGENPNREGLKDTPKRVTESLKYLLGGYKIDINEVINNATFTFSGKDMVVVKNIELYSMCEHHILPFIGKCHIGYLPSGKIIGLSKLPRIVDVFARRLQVQERLTNQIAKTINDYLKPLGVGVIIEASHLCMMMRGVKKQNSVATTSCMLGLFRDNPATRNEFLQLIK